VGPPATFRRSGHVANRTNHLTLGAGASLVIAQPRPPRGSERASLWSVHISTIFTDLPFLERLGAARAEGFGLVEWWWSESSVEDLTAELRRLSLRVSSINGPVGDLEGGERGIAHDPGRRQQFLSEITEAIALARAVGAPRINVLVGRDSQTRPRSEQLAQIQQNLTDAARVASTQRVTLLVEGLNEVDVPGYLLPSADDALDMVVRIDSPAVRLLYDAYHVGKSGQDPTSNLARFADYIGHAQFAAGPDRTAPEPRKQNALTEFDSALRRVGYGGAIGLEFIDPRGDGLKRLAALQSPARSAAAPGADGR
jgi:hydroxypyruvate isomerase